MGLPPTDAAQTCQTRTPTGLIGGASVDAVLYVVKCCGCPWRYLPALIFPIGKRFIKCLPAMDPQSINGPRVNDALRTLVRKNVGIAQPAHAAAILEP